MDWQKMIIPLILIESPPNETNSFFVPHTFSAVNTLSVSSVQMRYASFFNEIGDKEQLMNSLGDHICGNYSEQ